MSPKPLYTGKCDCELTYQEMADAVNAIPGWSGFSANDMKELMTAIAEARTRKMLSKASSHIGE